MSGEHWDEFPPDNPPTDHEGFRWCAQHGSWECEHEPKVWGGQLLGWTTQKEVDALEKSIKTDW